MKRLFLAAGIITCCQITISAKIIFFNLNTLLETNQGAFAWQVGPLTLARYGLLNLSSCNQQAIIGRLFNALRTWQPQEHPTCGQEQYLGHTLPPLLVAWHCGTAPCTQLLAAANQMLDTPHNRHVASDAERAVFRAIIKAMLDPATYAATQSLLPGALECVRKCRRAGHAIYIIANCHPETFAALIRQFPELFSLFDTDKIIISGHEHTLIPSTIWCTDFFVHASINPTECYLVDADEQHRQAMTPLHMHAAAQLSQIKFT